MRLLVASALTFSFVAAAFPGATVAQAPSPNFAQQVELGNNVADLLEFLKPFIIDIAAMKGMESQIAEHARTAGKELRWTGHKYALIGVDMKQSGETPPIPWGQPTYYGTGNHPSEAIVSYLMSANEIRPGIGQLYTFAEEASFYVVVTLKDPQDLHSEETQLGRVRHPFSAALRARAAQEYADNDFLRQLKLLHADQILQHSLRVAQSAATDEVQRAQWLELKINLESQREVLRKLDLELKEQLASIRKASSLMQELQIVSGVLNGAAMLHRLATEIPELSQAQLEAIGPDEQRVLLYLEKYKRDKDGVRDELLFQRTIDRKEFQEYLREGAEEMRKGDAPKRIIDLFSGEYPLP